MSTCINNLNKRDNKAFSILGKLRFSLEHVYIYLVGKWRVCAVTKLLNNLISHSYHELKGIDGEKEYWNWRMYSNLGHALAWNTASACTRYLLALLSCDYELLFLLLLVAYVLRLQMNNHQTNINPNLL